MSFIVAQFGLIFMDLERLENGARVLVLNVRGEQRTLQWKRGIAVPEIPDVLTRRAVFSLFGRLVGHLPVCSWLHVATSAIKRRASTVTKSWDDETTDTLLVEMVTKTIAIVKKNNPARGDWCIQGKEINVWISASSLAIGVLLEKNRAVIEGACWLRPMTGAAHINLAELDAILKGINLALR